MRTQTACKLQLVRRMMQAASTVCLPAAVIAKLRQTNVQPLIIINRTPTCWPQCAGRNSLDEQVVKIIHHHSASLALALLGAPHLVSTLVCRHNTQQQPTSSMPTISLPPKGCLVPIATAHRMSRLRWLLNAEAASWLSLQMHAPCIHPRSWFPQKV